MISALSEALGIPVSPDADPCSPRAGEHDACAAGAFDVPVPPSSCFRRSDPSRRGRVMSPPIAAPPAASADRPADPDLAMS